MIDRVLSLWRKDGRAHQWVSTRNQTLTPPASAAARTWSWLVRIGPVDLDLRHGVEADGTGSRTTVDIEGPAVVVLAYGPVARYALGRLVKYLHSPHICV